jgi:hypothetical protein
VLVNAIETESNGAHCLPSLVPKVSDPNHRAAKYTRACDDRKRPVCAGCNRNWWAADKDFQRFFGEFALVEGVHEK